MNETSINATMQGGTAGLVGVGVAHIENLYVGAPIPAPAAAQPAGPIPPCPYPGLAYFGPEDTSRFFGREQAIQALVGAVAKSNFTALVGASGSGKSSVVLAGLWPTLVAQGSWRSTYFRIGTEPDKNPFAALARALEPLTGERGLSDKLEEVQKLAQKLAAGSISLSNYIGQCRAANPGKRILLIADQFEEAFTLVPDKAMRNSFIDTLIAAFPDPALTVTPDVCLVLTLRADFYSAALRHRPLTDRLQDHVENLGPMTRGELRDAIEKPAEAVNVGFEPGLVDTILDDVEKRPGSLPLLQFALREMWGRLKTPLLTRPGYDGIGGVEGALAKRAQAIFEDATQHEMDAASVALFRRLFTRLVTLGEGAEDTRRIAAKQELGPDEWSLAQRLAGEDNRLVVTASTASGQETAEVVHEALIRNWPELVNWVSRDRAFISWRSQLKPRLDEWRANPSDPGTLLRGGPLVVAEDWFARRGDDLNQEEKGFITACASSRDAEKRRAEEALKERQAQLKEVADAQEKTALAQQERAVAQEKTTRAQRWTRWALTAIAAIIAITAGLFYWQYNTDARKLQIGHDQLTEAITALGVRQKQLAEAQSALDIKEGQLDVAKAELETNKRSLLEQEAAITQLQRSLEDKKVELQHQHANLLGELANAQLSQGNPDGALRFAGKGAEDDLALQLRPEIVSTSIAALEATVSKSNWRLAFVSGKSLPLSISFSPDGSRIVTASRDKTARIWDAKTATEIAVLRGHEGEVTFAAFSPDGSRIVTASDDKTAREWDAKTAAEIVVLRGHGDGVNSAAFSPDGSRIVTASDDKTARIWDAKTATEIAVLRGHEGPVTSAAFGPDGSRIVTASADHTARIWDAKTATEIAVLRGHQDALFSAAFSPDGSRIVTASVDETARVWDAKTAAQIVILRGHESWVTSATFNPDGSRIVTASWDKTARVWDAKTAAEIVVLRGHEGGVNSAAFSPDGSRIATASLDKTARVWDAQIIPEIAVLRGHEGVVTSASFSPDETRIVTASWDKTARVWDAKTATEIAALRGHESWVTSATFNPDGSRIVTASRDKTARVWEAKTATEIAALRGHEGEVTFAAFSPDGSRIVTASRDKTARIWDAKTATEIAVLRGHEGEVTFAAFSPDGSRIVTASNDKTAREWDAKTAAEIVVLRGHGDGVNSAAFSPDGSRIVTASADRAARIWDAKTATEIAVLRGHEGPVTSAAFGPDGSRIVTASADHTARIWDAKTATEIAVLRGHEGPVTSAAFSPDGSRIVTASWDKTAGIWDVHLATMQAKGLLAEVCQHLMIGFSSMTRDEMRLAGYPDSEPPIDVCAGFAEARP